MKKTLYSAVIMLTLGLIACKSTLQKQALASNQHPTTPAMHSFVSIFEIPATDLSRAVKFYQAILEIPIEKIEMPGMQMGIFPYEGQVVTGVIIQAEGYQPSAHGVSIYLNGGDNLQPILDKVEKNGGKIVVPKTPHADESGYFAMFLDTEGNRLGLDSPN